MSETAIIIGFILYSILACIGTRAAYRNGVNDGYHARAYPNHPGYQKAKKILQETKQFWTLLFSVKNLTTQPILFTS